jgi:hypothetical protein
VDSARPAFVAGLLLFLRLSSLSFPPPAAGAESCAAPGTGWCLARRVTGDSQNGELGFRFGEPLDADGDGQADIAAGARFKRHHNARNGNAAVWSGPTGALIRTWEGEYRDGLFGHWALLTPDVNGDGLADLIASAPNAVVEGVGRGVVSARSPKTGEEIWRHVGGSQSNFGWDMTPAGDADGDGRSDVFVGAPALGGGRAYLLSGKDGTSMRIYAPRHDTPQFGWYVARIDDVDADGAGDLAVSAFQEMDAAGVPIGGVYIFSGRAAKELHHIVGADGRSSFGEVVAAVADADGDRRADLAVSAPRTNDETRSRPGEVHFYSTVTGKLLRTWSGSQPGELFGRMVVAAGDLDGDGVDDVAVSAPWHSRQGSERVGRMELRSGKSGEVLHELFGDTADCWFGWHVRRAPDPDGRGRPALLISSLRHPVEGQAGVGVVDWYVLRREKR